MLETLLVQQTKSQFLENYFLRLPYAEPKGAQELTQRGGWEIIAASLKAPDADVMVVKAGERWAESRTPSVEEAKSLYAKGYTLLVRHAERQDAELQNLAQGFAREFLAPVDVHLYATPAEAFGFGWHYDVEDVFILQLEGTKEYSLRKNTVNPWPVLDNMPHDLRYERELMPMMKCELAAGDWLYIPHGYWHRGTSKTDSISLAVGIMAATGLDMLDVARKRLVESIRWRQRLPMFGAESSESLKEMAAELGRELSEMFSDPAFLRQFLKSREPDDGEEFGKNVELRSNPSP
jgi:ribosomal protein L16 Arg81 hydroxylase